MAEKRFEFPAMIRNLPEIDVPLEGVRGRLLQGEGRQAVFFEIEPIGAIPEHSHGAQFGVVLEGEMSLTIDGKTRRYGRGDAYYIPAGVPHGAVFHTAFRAIDVFDEPARYRKKG
ncbi:MAG: cupin domain-containing protein [Myxococcales bacterium]|nr:MAG: cupin domain-containing protein [Myxococcales bacterium]